MTDFDSILKLPQPYPTSCYCWGSGGGGTLGIENGAIRKIALRPCRVKIPTTSPIVSIASGHHRTAVITNSGHCYSWGKPPLGRKTSSITSEAMSKRIQINRSVKKIIHGETHSIVVRKDGSVYSFGDASDGKLGLPNKSRGHVKLPTKIPIQKKCIDAACGFSLTTLLLDNGYDVIVYGSGGFHEQPRNRRNEKQRKTEPQMYTFPIKLISISGGTSHLAAVSSDGHGYTWGLTQNGRLGHGGEDDYHLDMIESNPKRIEFFYCNAITVVKAFCGGAHTSILTDDGRIFSFGWNAYFQCGVKRDKEKDTDVFLPNEVKISSTCVVDMSCGFAHSVAIDVSGGLHVWGFNEEGQLGVGHERNVDEPTLVEFDEATDSKFTIVVSAGKTHTACIRSTCSASEFCRRIEEITVKEHAIATLLRFRNYAMLQLYFQRSRQLKEAKKKNEEIIVSLALSSEEETSQELEISDSTDLFTDSSSISSEEKDESIDSKEDKNNENEDPSIRLMELHLMAIEDERSRQMTNLDANFERKRMEVVKRKKCNLICEIIRRYEIFCMTREDRYSNAFLQVEKDELREQMRINKERISLRDAKTIERINKEADRMLKAKFKPRPKYQPKKHSKQRPKKGICVRPKPAKIQDFKSDSEPPMVPIYSNSERNRRLLLRREKRIIRHEQIIQEQDRRRLLELEEDEIKKKSVFLQRANDQISEMMTKLNSLLAKNKTKDALEMIQLQNKLPLIQIEDDKNLTYPTRSVSQWSKELC